MRSRRSLLLLWGGLSTGVLAGDVLQTSGFTTCVDNPQISVQNLNITYDRATNQVTFDVAGTSTKSQNVSATLSVSAYGNQVYNNTFNPCDAATAVQQLCPVPAGSFSAQGVQNIPDDYASQIPSIAFSIPDLEGQAKLQLNSIDGGQPLACIQSDVNNGKTMTAPAVSYIAIGITGAALVISGIAALANAGTVGGHSPSPGFGTVLTWFQGVQMNGMMSVQYPPVYQNFAKNFAFSGGLIPWTTLQTTIDNFRQATGGNLTNDNVQYLHNASLVYTSGSSDNNASITSKRGLAATVDLIQRNLLTTREVGGSVNGSQAGNGTSSQDNGSNSKATHIVHGIQGYVEQLSIPQANTFMTVLLIFAIVIASIAVAILLLKVILEIWALFASFPKKLRGFRKRYWGLLGRTITNLILLLYGVWTLYCVFQFTDGDSWAAKVLAGVTLGIFTLLLAAFTFRIWQIAHRYKQLEGTTSALYEDKETWRKYSLFYDNYKRGYWWIFMPAIVYMFAKGCVIAGANGHGLTQTVGQLIVESLMLILVLWCRPFVSTSGNVLNIFIQVVRVLSVICILVFVEELGIAQSTKTITGVILISVQSVLTVVLGILLAVNAIIVCVRENPHRRQRKAAEKFNRDTDNLTPLSPRNSLLMSLGNRKASTVRSYPLSRSTTTTNRSPVDKMPTRPWNRSSRTHRTESAESLIKGAGAMGRHDRSTSGDSYHSTRQPTLPNVGFPGRAY